MPYKSRKVRLRACLEIAIGARRLAEYVLFSDLKMLVTLTLFWTRKSRAWVEDARHSYVISEIDIIVQKWTLRENILRVVKSEFTSLSSM